MKTEKKSGKLFICATPIGNMEDITLRVIRTLKEADEIICEDTRITRKLLSRYDIHRPLSSFNQANEQKILPKIIDKLSAGKNLALVSDAGTPGISDPGHILVRRCIEENIEYEIVPGASAVLAAAVVSGLPTDDLRFLGFLPRKSSERLRLLSSLKDQPSTLIFYESPKRVKHSLKDIEEALGDRPMAVVREMTKKFEERIRGGASSILKTLDQRELKGEIVLVISGKKIAPEAADAESIRSRLLKSIGAGSTKKEAVKKVAEETGVSKKKVYDIAVKL